MAQHGTAQPIDTPPCDHDNCPELAHFRVAFDKGTVNHPHALEMDLCAQHYMRANPLGTQWLVKDYAGTAKIPANPNPAPHNKSLLRHLINKILPPLHPRSH